ncbi:MAG TPA: thiamine phosphate synthase [Caulobacteraceae bacterium]|nr:thiamine phosphate synthase [Caulobacteraceae bacterium]
MTAPACRLYLVTPPAIADLAAFGRALGQALEAGDVGALQIRLKQAPQAELEAVVRMLRPMTASRDIPLILNDRPDLAAAFGCDGVHVGQDDASCAQARRLVGHHRIVGVTCHASRHLAMEAAEAGADYVAFGAFFATQTKQAKTRADPELLEIWQETMLTPCVAIGGITPTSCRALVTAGADFVAVSSGVWSHPDGPAVAVAHFNAEIAAGLAQRPLRALAAG